MNKTVYQIFCSGKLTCTVEDRADVGCVVQALLNEHWNDDNITIKRFPCDLEGE